MVEMELAQHGVMQFVAADFEIHFGTIDGTRAEIIKPQNDFFPSLCFEGEARRHHQGGFAGDLLPLGPYLRRIEKDNPERGQFVFFNGGRLTRHTTGEDQQNNPAAEHFQAPSSNRIVNHRHGGRYSKLLDHWPEPGGQPALADWHP